MSIITVGMATQILKQSYAHDHAVWEIVFNLQGSGHTIIGEKSYDYGPGTIICLPPNIPHTKVSQDGFKDVYIQPTSFSLAGIAEENGVLLFQDDNEKSFETLILLAHRAFHEKKSNHRLLVDSLFEAMNQLLVGWQHYTPEDKDVDELKNKLIDSFTNPDFTISELLAEGPYCNDHLRRRFKQSTSQTPIEYLTHLRIEYAKKLMSENNMLRYSIGEIAAMSGYYDSHYFSRIFKKKTGKTPAEFMKNI